MDFEPLSLQEICRSVIRTILRNNIDIENPDIKKTVHSAPKRPRKKRALRRCVVPIFEESDIETSDNLTDEDDRRDLGRVRLSPDRSGSNGREFNTILDLVLGSLTSYRSDRRQTDRKENSETESRTEESTVENNQENTESSPNPSSSNNEVKTELFGSCKTDNHETENTKNSEIETKNEDMIVEEDEPKSGVSSDEKSAVNKEVGRL